MLGVQNSLPVTNSVKFGQREHCNYDNCNHNYDYDDSDTFSQEDIESERDAN